MVKQFIETSINKGILASQPTRKPLRNVAGYLSRSDLPTNNPVVVIGEVAYAPGTRPEGITHWKSVADFVLRQEPETLTYLFLADEENPDVLYTFERFTGHEAKAFHVGSSIISSNIQVQKDIRIGLKLRFWEESEESFYREPSIQ